MDRLIAVKVGKLGSRLVPKLNLGNGKNPYICVVKQANYKLGKALGVISSKKQITNKFMKEDQHYQSPENILKIVVGCSCLPAELAI